MVRILVLVGLLLALDVMAEEVALSFVPEGAHDAVVRDADGGAVEIETTGSDPYVYTTPFPEGTDLRSAPVLAFEYFSLTGTGPIQVFADPPVREDASLHAPGLGASQGWSPHRIDLAPLLDRLEAPVRRLRIDFGRAAGHTVQIRNMAVRPLNAEERALAARAAEAKEREAALDAALSAYLRGPGGAALDIEVTEDQVRIRGALPPAPGDSVPFYLVEIPVEATAPDAMGPRWPVTAAGGAPFSETIPRYAEDGRDRLYSRWALASGEAGAPTLQSHAQYAGRVAARPGLTPAQPRNRKGLGAFSPGRPVEDVVDLGVSAVTVNILLDHFMRTAPGDGRSPYAYGGRTWYTDNGAVAQLDSTMRGAAAHGLVVSAIILVNQATGAAEGDFRRIVAHPDADPAGIFVMPNFTGAEGVAAYAAALNFLAERYSRPDGEFGRIHHWILHNEVNSGWVWTNMGEKSALRYMDAYHKSMRMAQLIAWQYDPHARVYISLEHHWNTIYNPHCYKGRDLLALLLEFSGAEGDFPWGVALHPYPEDLRDPRAWEDETAWYSFDTPRITFKNLEVIDAWAHRPEARYRGEIVRDVQFTEQGPNSPDYSEASLRDQAASMAYAWKKMAPLKSVSMFHFHNWVDNRHEGGLRIGLRRFPDDEDEPLGKKPVWYVFQALETAAQEEAIAFAKEVIGIEDWDNVVYTGEITETKID